MIYTNTEEAPATELSFGEKALGIQLMIYDVMQIPVVSLDS